jgi:putative oxidoreductase
MNTQLRKLWPLPLRLLVGVGFAFHGFPKLFTGAGHASFAETLRQLGVPFPGPASWVVGAIEFFGGVAILEGVLFSIATAVLLVDMLAAMFAAHLHHGLSFIGVTGMTTAGPQLGMPGAEVNLLYVAALLALFIGGPGPLSISGVARRARRASPSPPAREAHA